MKKEIIILHETDGRPYYKAVEELAKKENISLSFLESSIFRLSIAKLVKKEWDAYYSKQLIKNIIFRITVPFVTNKKIILAMAPYDYRICWYGLLMRKNDVYEHTSWPYWGTRKVPRKYGPLTFLAIGFWRRFFKKAKKPAICVLREVKTGIIENFKPKFEPIVVPHTVDFKENDQEKETSSKLRVLFVGKLIREKGLEVLNQLILENSNPNIEFSIVGDGKDKKLIEPSFSKANYYGLIKDREKLSKIYLEHDILVVPSIKKEGWEELFGIVNIEAMANGLCVIASNHVGPRNIIETGKTGFIVEENNLSLIKDKLKELESNRELLLSIQANAKSSAEDYLIANIEKRWREALK